MSLKDELLKSGLKGKVQTKIEFVLRPEILLGPNTPKPMHGVAPRVVLGAKWWDQERRAAYKSTCDHCLACGVHKDHAKRHKWIEGHEIYSIDYAKGRLTYVECVPLCHFCHNYIHDGRLNNLLLQGKISQQKYKAIIQHGDQVLRQASLNRVSYEARQQVINDAGILGNVAEWGAWRLVVNGKEYPPLYKNFEEWKKVFGVS